MRLLTAIAVALVLAPAASGITGQQRVLVLQVTWGPQPWAAAQGREALAAAGAYIRSASFGRTWIDGTATDWLHALTGPPGSCDIRAVETAANAAARAAGFDLGSYTTLGYAFPDIGCPWGGAYFPPGIWMNGRMDTFVVAHELGHTYGIVEEGPGWACGGAGCESHDYANPYSVMGHGMSDFDAFEKLTFGWIDRVARPEGDGEFTIAAIDRPGPDAHVLHVLTAADEYWFEYRPPEPVWSADEPTATPGIAVIAGTNGLSSRRSRFTQRDLLLLDPVGSGRPSIFAGETFTARGAFALTVGSTAPARATVALRWTDRTRPSPPRILSAGRTSLTWAASADAASGIDAYDVSVDGRRVRRVRALLVAGTVYLETPRRVRYAPLGRGRHRVTVVAMDRAGNRSRATSRSVVVT